MIRSGLLGLTILLWINPIATADGFPSIRLVRVVTGLASPVFVTDPGDGRLFVVEQRGTIRIAESGTIRTTPFLDVTALVRLGSERGLLGLAFDPSFAENGKFYVNYTDLSGDTVIERYSVSSDPSLADPSSGELVLRIDQPFANHNGGHLTFGPDGMLYIGTGDGGSGGDPLNSGQTLSTLLGKMLRIDVSGPLPYSIPVTNPFFSEPAARSEIWAYGLRNPWRYSFDRGTGDLYIGDVGQNAIEEIDFQPSSSPGGENYGWRRMEGSRCFNPSTGCNDGSLVLPILEYDHSQGCSVTGGYVYRGTTRPALEGIYFFGDFCSGRLWGARRDEQGTWASAILLETGLTVSSFGEDSRGNLYLIDYGGSVFRIETIPTRRRPVKRP